MSDSDIEFEKCSICYEYKSFVNVDCCKQSVCGVCLERWLQTHTGCPFCRANVVEKGWTHIGINAGYKISVICDTLKEYTVRTISISVEEFDVLSPYFEDYVRVDRPTEMGNDCICSKQYSGYCGTQKCVIVDLVFQEYFEFYVCSHCADYNPHRVWNELLKAKKDHSIFEPDLRRIRDELIFKMCKVKEDGFDFIVRKGVENTLYKYYLNEKGYLSIIEFQFIVNLIKICSGNMYLPEGLILNFMIKYLAEPFSPKIHGNFFVKHFVRNAWKKSVECKGFLGLYPIISLWNIIRDPDEKFVKKSDTYYEAMEYPKEWLNEVGLS